MKITYCNITGKAHDRFPSFSAFFEVQEINILTQDTAGEILIGPALSSVPPFYFLPKTWNSMWIRTSFGPLSCPKLPKPRENLIHCSFLLGLNPIVSLCANRWSICNLEFSWCQRGKQHLEENEIQASGTVRPLLCSQNNHQLQFTSSSAYIKLYIQRSTDKLARRDVVFTYSSTTVSYHAVFNTHCLFSMHHLKFILVFSIFDHRTCRFWPLGAFETGSGITSR